MSKSHVTRPPDRPSSTAGQLSSVVASEVDGKSTPDSATARCEPLHEPPTKTLAVHGTLWIVVNYALLTILRFISNIILTWFVAPRVLGVMALVNLFVLGLQMISDLGVRQCVIQSRHG